MCGILGQLWSDYRDDEQMEDFIEYNDLGLPMAYFVAEDLVAINEKGKLYITETFDLFLESLGIKDEGFEDLNQVLIWAKEKGNQ
jgi:hypothetical protein